MVDSTKVPVAKALRREWPLLLAVGTLGALLVGQQAVSQNLDQPLFLIAILVGLCGVILTAAIAIVRHADELAHRWGEPAGTLLLTLSITGLEVAMVAFVMSTGTPKPTLARDTMFAVVMLVMNGFLGSALLVGGIRHREQPYNPQSANAFLSLIVPLTVLGLILPNFTRATPGPLLSTFQMVFLSIMSVGVYSGFLFLQNQRHRGFFVMPDTAEGSGKTAAHGGMPTAFHGGMLFASGIPLVLLAKKMSVPMEAMVSRLGAPPALSGLVMAILVLTPESIAAIQAAKEDQLQRSINVLLGSVLASIGLTIPLVIAVSLITHRPLELGLGASEMVMLVLTLVTSVITFAIPRTNVLSGMVHLLLFAAYLLLLFDR